MALTIKKVPLPAEKIPIKCPYLMDPTRLVIHNTANDASAVNEIAYMQSNDKQVSFHYAVDDKQAVQGIELWRNAWHAGDGADGTGNRRGIAIEICYSKSGGKKFEKAEENAAELAARLLIDFGWGLDKVTKHQDYSPQKRCPHRTLDMGWDRFLKMVKEKRDALLKKNKAPADLAKTVLNGYTIERAKDFSVVYWDKSKKKGTAQSYINGGFFGYYKEGITPYTLPVGNLVADITTSTSLKNVIFDKQLKPHIQNGKFRYNTTDNPADSRLRGKKVTTLILPRNGSPYMQETASVPVDARYAISGIPVIRDGIDVSYTNFVKPQGWDESPFYAADRNFIGLKGTSIYIVSGKSKTSNFVAKSEVYEALKDFGFSDLMALDGGGSFYHKYEGKADVVWADRDVNNLVIF